MLDSEESARGDIARDRLAIETLSFFCVPLDESRAVCDLSLRLSKWLALFASEDDGKVIDVIHDQLIPTTKDLGAIGSSESLPDFESSLCGGDRLLHILERCHCDIDDGLTGGWIDHSASGSIARGLPCSIDEEFVLDQCRITQVLIERLIRGIHLFLTFRIRYWIRHRMTVRIWSEVYGRQAGGAIARSR